MNTLKEKRQLSRELYIKSSKTPTNIVYNPLDENHRYALAYHLRNELLGNLGFIKTSFHKEFRSGECVYLKHVRDHIYIAVYTTIRFHECRYKSKDAIRVTGIYKNSDGVIRPLVKTDRVFRRGKIKDIVNRLTLRIKTVKNCLIVGAQNDSMRMCPRTGCTSPMFLSKKGRWVCSEFCFRSLYK